MEQIAAAAGVAKATIYDNFDGKAGLTRALVDRFGQQLLADFAAEVTPGMTAEEMIRTGVGVFLRDITDHSSVYGFVALQSEDREIIDTIATPLITILRVLLESQGADTDRAQALGTAALHALLGTGAWWSESTPMARDELQSLLGDFIWGGLVAAGLRPDSAPDGLDELVRATVVADQ